MTSEQIISATSALGFAVAFVVGAVFNAWLVALAALLIAAMLTDILSQRIPNVLVAGGAILGIAYNAFWPQGLGLSAALLGLAMGFAVLLPFYLFKVMGAGDVKLMAMAGAFVGPRDAFGAALAVMFVGGVLALVYALRVHALGQLFRNVASRLQRFIPGVAAPDESPRASVGDLPYGVAIATGTLGYLLLWR